jgi:hypothetical protein
MANLVQQKNDELRAASEALLDLETELMTLQLRHKDWREKIRYKIVLAFYKNDVRRQQELFQKLEARSKVIKYSSMMSSLTLICNIFFCYNERFYVGFQYPTTTPKRQNRNCRGSSGQGDGRQRNGKRQPVEDSPQTKVTF